MVKKLTTKAELSEALEEETRRYLDEGGTVDAVAHGVSGNDPQNPTAFRAGSLFPQPRAPRTFVPEVVAAIEARRLARFKPRTVVKRTRTPKTRRKIMYDDFGEPIRKIWVDD